MKPKGWFSRRHETRGANDRARAAYANRAVSRPRQRWNVEEKRWEKSTGARENVADGFAAEIKRRLTDLPRP